MNTDDGLRLLSLLSQVSTVHLCSSGIFFDYVLGCVCLLDSSFSCYFFGIHVDSHYPSTFSTFDKTFDIVDAKQQFSIRCFDVIPHVFVPPFPNSISSIALAFKDSYVNENIFDATLLSNRSYHLKIGKFYLQVALKILIVSSSSL